MKNTIAGNAGYKPAIGIECHVQLKTLSKLFAPVNNDSRDAPPNTHISHICLGMPGALPVLNYQALVLAGRAALALRVEPQRYSAFDRKHYFYPDLPKGYQITQQAHPIILGGSVEITVDGEVRKIAVERAHIEEDAGKSTHPETANYSLVDLNRAGTPLLEIVSAPEMTSAAEARAYSHELYLLMRYAGVSEADLYHGNMRFDVNVSVSKTSELGTRSETKNLNSFRSVERAVEYEVDRQIHLLEKGQPIVQETRGWNEAKQKTFSQRSKEEAHDYRYFPEPDVPPVILDEDFMVDIKKDFPPMPDAVRQRLAKLQLLPDQIEVLIESELDDEGVSYQGVLFSDEVPETNLAFIANLMIQVEIPLRRSAETSQPRYTTEQRTKVYTSVASLSSEGKLSSTNAKALLQDLLFSGAEPKDIAAYAEQQGYIQLSDSGAIDTLVDDVIKKNPGAAEDIRKGELKAIGFLVGQVMKASHGKANPGLVKELLVRRLSP